MAEVVVISLGGSIVSPDDVDLHFLTSFKKSISDFLSKRKDVRIIFTVGGGGIARKFQSTARTLNAGIAPENLDWMGIRATHLNAEVIRSLFGIEDVLVTNPVDDDISFTSSILVAGGWKPGFSTDTDAVYLAIRFKSNLVINLSNTDGVYTSDPRKDANAKFIDDISWTDFISLTGESWHPGLNVPFDPVASALAQKNSISVICADGHNIANTISILSSEKYKGTLIHP